MERLVCPHCGAAVEHRSLRFCEYCGTEIPRVEDQLPRSFDEQRAVRLQRLEAHPSFVSWVEAAKHPVEAPSSAALDPESAETPDSSRNPLRNRLPVIGSFALILLILLIANANDDLSGLSFSIVMAIVFFGALFAAVLATWRPWQRRADASSMPLQPRAAIVIGERSAVAGRHGSAVYTNYFLTLEFSDGLRHEFPVGPELAGRLSSEDLGAAFILRNNLLEFRRLKV